MSYIQTRTVNNCVALIAAALITMLSLSGFAWAGEAGENDDQQDVDTELVWEWAASPGLKACRVNFSAATRERTTVNDAWDETGSGGYVFQVEEGGVYALGLTCKGDGKAKISGFTADSVQTFSRSIDGNEVNGWKAIFTASRGMGPGTLCDDDPDYGECIKVRFVVQEGSPTNSELVGLGQQVALVPNQVDNQVGERLQAFEQTIGEQRRWFHLTLGGTFSLDHTGSDEEEPRQGLDLVGEAMIKVTPNAELYVNPGLWYYQQSRFEAVRLVPNLQPANQWVEERSQHAHLTAGLSYYPIEYVGLTARLGVGRTWYEDGAVPLSQQADMNLVLGPAKTEAVWSGGAQLEVSGLIGGMAGAYLRLSVDRNFEGIQNYRGASPDTAPDVLDQSYYRTNWNIGLGADIAPLLRGKGSTPPPPSSNFTYTSNGTAATVQGDLQ